MAIQLKGRRVFLQPDGTGKLKGPYTPPLQLPAKPVISVASVSTNTLRLTRMSGENVRVDVSETGTGGWTPLVPAPMANVFDHTGLVGSTTRYYRPVATNDVGETVGDIQSNTTAADTVSSPAPTPGTSDSTIGTIENGQQITINALTGESFGATGPTVELYLDGTGKAVGDPATLEDGLSAIAGTAPSTFQAGGKVRPNALLIQPGDGTYTRHTSTFAPTAEAFISFWIKVDTLTHASSFKPVWLMDGARGDMAGYYDLVLLTKPNTNPEFAFGGNGSGGALGYSPSEYIQPGEWTRVALWIQDRGIDAQGMYLQFINATNLMSVDTTVKNGIPMFADGISSTTFDHLKFMGHANNNNGGLNVRTEIDGVYIATDPTLSGNAAARIEIGDAENYADCRELYLCTPDTWADGSITATVHGPDDMVGKYLHIHRADAATAGGVHTNAGVGRLITEKQSSLTGGTAAFAYSTTALSDGAEITLTTDGSGGFTFGSKVQAAPLFVEDFSEYWEHGVRKERTGWVDGQKLLRDTVDPDSPYGGGCVNVYYRTQDSINAPLRIPGKPIVQMQNKDWIGNPAPVYSTPYPAGKYLYYSWYVYSKYDGHGHVRMIQDINNVDISTMGFIGPAEGELYGEWLAGSPSGMRKRCIYFGSGGISVEDGKFADGDTVTGETSGASFVVNYNNHPTSHVTGGSNKYTRLWGNDSNKPDVRVSWTQKHLTGTDSGSLWYNTGSLTTRRWRFMEMILTPDWLEAKLDGNVIHEGPMTGQVLLEGYHVRPAQIGWDGYLQRSQQTSLCSYYVDHSLKRVYLTNAPTMAEATKFEMQIPTTWADGKVTLEGRFRSLDPAVEPVWLIYADAHDEIASVQIN